MTPRLIPLLAVGLLGVPAPALAQGPEKKAALKPGVRVAIVGDSITEQKLYSRFIAAYLTAAHPELDAHIVQLGWSGERAGGFLARMDNDLLPWKPDVVTLCYGMNDGEYTAYRPDIGKRYGDPLKQIVSKLKAAGATAVVGSPGCVDQYTFGRGPNDKAATATAASGVYNDNLAHLRDIAKQTAADAGMPFSNVHDTMTAAMRAAQEKFGDKYHVGGKDGVHPAANGQLAMATAFLSAMDLTGDLGGITLDMKGESTARDGHTVVKAGDGTVEIESKRYPFAFTGQEGSPDGTRSIAPFLPFNERFNRLTLTVKNAPADKLKVTWGAESRTFTRAELEAGVNLAAAFVDHPLAGAYKKVDAAVADQQNFETFMIKQVITNHRMLPLVLKGDAEALAAAKTLAGRLWAKDAEKQAAAKKLVGPVRHTIKVTAE